jgi:epoxyqueuosine reductase
MLLINNELGNMLWLSAVLTSAPLTADSVADYEVCSPGCNLCVDVCLAKALGEELMKQLTCFNYAFKLIDGGPQIQCWACRDMS